MRLKENTLYVVADQDAHIHGGETGLYNGDTRHLRRLAWSIAGKTPTILSAQSSAPYCFDVYGTEHNLGHKQHLGFRRSVHLDGINLVETTTFQAFDATQSQRQIALHLDVDFYDMFEVRGLAPLARDILVIPHPDGLEWRYEGQDGVRRTTRVFLAPMGQVETEDSDHGAQAPQTFDSSAHELLDAPDATTAAVPAATARLVRYSMHKDTLTVQLCVQTSQSDQNQSSKPRAELEQDYTTWCGRGAAQTNNPSVQKVFTRASQDLRALLFETPQGFFPAAGIPWFTTPFGRDSLTIGLFTLPWYPEIAKATLRYLAAHQGKRINAKTLEAPGKILHEQRNGEASRTGRTPFQTYYGTVDATPLWVVLLGEHWRWSKDLALLRELEPNLQAALGWMASSDADPDQDGFLEYSPHPGGHTNQIWKDSGDSVFDEHGQDLKAPLAVVEVQAYAHKAYLLAGEIYQALGNPERAAHFHARAQTLQQQFHAAFWLPELQTYAHALDGNKNPARVLVSNPGHALWAGIVPEDIAPQLAQTLFGPRLWSGWGVRTLGEGQARYNPVSYHNGSVWPHDNAFLALGLARYGLRDHLAQLLEAQFAAAALDPDARLHELFAGFKREDAAHAPVPYPAACHPQGWDAAAPFAYLWAALGLTPLGPTGQAVWPASLGVLQSAGLVRS